MTLAAPVPWRSVSTRSESAGFGPLAVVTLALIGVLFSPIGQRSAHPGRGDWPRVHADRYWIPRRSEQQSRPFPSPRCDRDRGGTARGGARWRLREDRAVAGGRHRHQQSAAFTAWLGIGLRRETNRMAFFMVGDRPFGGYGIGGFEAALPAYYERYGPLERQYDHALLNHPLHMLVDLGVLGLAANLWLLGAFFVPPLWAVFAGTRSAERQAAGDLLALGCVVAVGAALFLSLWTAEWLYDAPINVPAFMLLALAASTCTTADGTPRRTRGWTILALPLGHTVMFLLGI